MTTDRDRALVAVTREHAKNIVQARSGWKAARDLDLLSEQRIVADAERMMADGTAPTRPHVSDWRDDARQAMQVITLSVDTIRVRIEHGESVKEDVDLVVRAIERLDQAMGLIDAAFPQLEAAADLNSTLQRVAVGVRDRCRRAAVSAPAQGERPEHVIDQLDLGEIVRRARR